MSDKPITNIKFSKIAFIIYSFSSYLGDIGQGSVVFSYVIMALVPFCINGNKPSYSLFWLCMIILTYPFIAQTIPIFFIYFFVYAFRNTTLTKFASFSFSLYASFFLLHLLLLKLGFVHDVTNELLKGYTHSLGFGNSNVLASFLMGMNLCIYIMSCKKNFWIGLISIILINQWMLLTTSSRTIWIATIIMVFVAICYKLNFIPDWSRYLFAILPSFFTFICYYFVTHSDSYPELDLLFSGRLDLLNYTLRHMSNLIWITGYVYDDALDCAYIGTVANGGILWLLFFLYSTTHCLYSQFDKIKAYLPVIVLILISGLTENTFCCYKPYNILFWMIILINPRNSLRLKSKKSYVTSHTQ